MLITDNTLRESFHLLFLRALAERWNGRFWAVKGGGSMRLFHHSDRYSVDLDADAPGFSLAALKSGATFAIEESARLMSERGWGRIEKSAFTKEGENVLRVKMMFSTNAGSRWPTKIEFSRRPVPLKAFAIIAKPGVDSLRELGMTAFLVPTYSREAMTALKIKALVGRSEFAVRDVYDLGHLLPTVPPIKELRAAKINRSELHRGSELVLGPDSAWKKYQSDVQPYLAGRNYDLKSWNDLRQRISRTFIGWANQINET